MSQQNKLKETIDRMVEDSIRRILPTVMNEVLLRTIAQSGVIQERKVDKPAYPYIPDNGGKKIKVVSRPPAPKKKGRPDLSHLLDETAGADFYAQAVRPDPEPVYEAVEEEEYEAPLRERVARNIDSLPPELQAMAEGIEIDDDGGEMWGDDEVPVIAPRGDDAGHLDTSARRVGVDFNRMRALTQMAETKKPRLSAEDARANAQFEALRLKRMREKLNGGKPIEE